MSFVTNVKHLQELIFNGYVKPIALGFTATGSDHYAVMQDLSTKEVYVKHTDNAYYCSMTLLMSARQLIKN